MTSRYSKQVLDEIKSKKTTIAVCLLGTAINIESSIMLYIYVDLYIFYYIS